MDGDSVPKSIIQEDVILSGAKNPEGLGIGKGMDGSRARKLGRSCRANICWILRRSAPQNDRTRACEYRRRLEMTQGSRASFFFTLFAAVPLFLAGCGMVAPPQAPSLYLPQPVTDLTASRVGNSVHLHWTMPKRTTDRILLKGDQKAYICRSVASGPCEPAGDAKFAPEAPAAFTDTLPVGLTSGQPQLITYTVELLNRNGRTAGPSNPAWSASGTAPAQTSGFAADIHTDGVLLHWQPTQDASSVIRIQRTLVPKPGTSTKGSSGLLRKGAEVPAQQTLEVAYAPQSDPAHAYDKDAAFNQSYRYTAQRVAVLTLATHKIEIASDPSPAAILNTRDIFPPSVPGGLVAVGSPEEHAIDLSWSPDTENDLAGYIVYRRETGSNTGATRISPAQPVTEPAFRDATALPGKRYAYAVSAIDQDGNESAHSSETEEALPQ